VLTLNTGENTADAPPAIDVSGGYAYFSVSTSPTKIVKINLSTFTRDSVLTLNTGENFSAPVVIDTSSGFGYAGLYTTPAKVVKFDLNTMTRSATLTFNSGEDDIYNAAIDVGNDTALFETSTDPSRIIQVKLSTFSRLDALTLDSGDGYLDYMMAIDTENGYVYVGGNDSSTSITAKVSYLPREELRLEYGKKSSTCGAISTWTQVGTPSGSTDWKMVNSSYLTDSALTTNVGSGVTDGNTTFRASATMEDTSQASEVVLGLKEFTEVEYSIEAATTATDGATYCFRLTDAGTAASYTYTNYAEATLSSSYSPTTNNAVTLSRHKAGVTATVTVSFELSSSVSTSLAVTFPSGFTVLSAPTSGSSCLSNFSFTSSTMTADKSNCSGPISMTGGTVTLPSAVGTYLIQWVNDAPGWTIIPVTDDDQVSITAAVDSEMTFDIDVATSDTETAAPYTLALGTLSDSGVTGSDDSSVKGIWIDLSTNAASGAIVQVKNVNGPSGLKSASVPADTIVSLSGKNAMSAGTENYGLCVSSSGLGVPAAVSGALQSSVGDFNGTCGATPASNSAGGLTTTFVDILNSASAPLDAGRAQVRVLATISTVTPAHDDYADTLVFRATPTY